jgi:hypothetical protein
MADFRGTPIGGLPPSVIGISKPKQTIVYTKRGKLFGYK